MADDQARGRAAYRRIAWDDTYSLLCRADASAELDADDLETLAEAAYFTGNVDHSVDVRTRLYTIRVRSGANQDAAMCAYRIHLVLALRGDMSPAMGWLSRAQRLLRQEEECTAHGYVCLAESFGNYLAGNLDGSLALARRASGIGEKFADPDLFNVGLHLAGRAMVALGDISGGVGLLDEAMVAVSTHEVRPVSCVWIYCSSIDVCSEMADFGRARAWTSEFERWVGANPGATPVSGSCRMHRSRIMREHGSWTQAEREARRACVDQNGTVALDAGQAWYQIAEIRRLVGDVSAAEEAFERAGAFGWEVQPGLALLRAAQGRCETALAGLARALAERPSDTLVKGRMLPARAEIAILSGNLELARAAVEDLTAVAHSSLPSVRAAAAHAAGALRFAEGDPAAALPELRAAVQIWGDLGLPYEPARSRMLIGRACAAIGDEDSARLEWDSCRAVFDRLGALPDLAEAERLLGCARPQQLPGGLSAREVEVLRLVAAGLSNQAVAEELSLSAKTVARHLSNIFGKIGVTTRAAATAYAFRNDVI